MPWKTVPTLEGGKKNGLGFAFKNNRNKRIKAMEIFFFFEAQKRPEEMKKLPQEC